MCCLLLRDDHLAATLPCAEQALSAAITLMQFVTVAMYTGAEIGNGLGAAEAPGSSHCAQARQHEGLHRSTARRREHGQGSKVLPCLCWCTGHVACLGGGARVHEGDFDRITHDLLALVEDCQPVSRGCLAKSKAEGTNEDGHNADRNLCPV